MPFSIFMLIDFAINDRQNTLIISEPSFIEKYIEKRFTQKEWQKLFNKLSQQQKDWINQNLIFTQGEMHGFYKIEPF